MMTKKYFLSNAKYAFLFFCFFLAIFINNTIPYISLPTMGQALWTMGYAKSLGNSGFFSVYAHDIGIPKPAAIAFGLSAVIPINWFIKFGMLPEAAYSFVFAIWLAVAFWGCYRFSRLFSLDSYLASLFSLLWLITPVIIKHSGYSMLMLGVALIPFYCWSAFQFYTLYKINLKAFLLSYALFLFAVIVSIFMDGYTFMMFAVAASGMMLFSVLFTQKSLSLKVLKLFLHFFSFLLSYLLYSLFIGKSSYQAESLDFFRGWGLDLSFIITPTKGIFWLSDFLNLSVSRHGTEYFGDASVWETSFSIPFLVLGFLGWIKNKNKCLWTNCFLLIGLFSLYMSLGPSFKYYSMKPDNYPLVNTMANTMLMPAEYALGPTGNSFISKYLPGFNVMRASYRWIALCVFSFWCMIIMYAENKKKVTQYLIVLLLLLVYMPHIRSSWEYGRANYLSVGNINDRFVDKLKVDIQKGSNVAFIPWNNDFFANYLAPFSEFKTFNIGGDKNLDEAKNYWPSVMINLQGGITSAQVPYITQLLLNKRVDYIVIPYVNMLWSAHYWVCPKETLLPLSEETRNSLTHDLSFYCPGEIKQNLKEVVSTLKDVSFFDVVDRDLYAVVSVNNEKYKEFIDSTSSSYPLLIDQQNYALTNILKRGWYYRENDHVWSKSNAEVILNVPNAPARFFNFKYNVLVKNKNEPAVVVFRTSVNNQILEKKETIKNTDEMITSIPIDHSVTSQKINIDFINAQSPAELGISPDIRVLGISLQSISTSD